MMSCKMLPSVPVPHYNYYNPMNYCTPNWMPTYIPTAYDYNTYYNYLNAIKFNGRMEEPSLMAQSPPLSISSLTSSSLSPASSPLSSISSPTSCSRLSAFYDYASTRLSYIHEQMHSSNVQSESNQITERTSSVIMKVENEKIYKISEPGSIDFTAHSCESSRSSCGRGSVSCSEIIEEFICGWVDCHR